ncbi:MAG: G1 family glutamic endopeptidase [Acidimicrobiales bacterium]
MKGGPRFKGRHKVASAIKGGLTSTFSSRNTAVSFWRGVPLVILTVLALSVVNTSPASASIRVTRPGVPRYLRAVTGSRSMKVLFAPPASNGGLRITRYVVDVHPSNRLYTCRSSDCSLSSLTNGVTYFFTVAAVNRLGRGRFSGRSNVITPEPPAPRTATVTFNANGCSGTMASESESIGTTVSLSTNTFTCGGYAFSGWNSAPNGSGTSYANGAPYAFTTNITLYAQWTATPVSTPFVGQSSTNWSGYVLPTSSVVTYASAQWTVPTLNCATTANSNSSTWVGTGDNGGAVGALLQTGVEEDCVNGVQENYGWWEIVPATPNNEEAFTNFPVSPGDSIKAQVYQATSGQWVTVVQDLTTGLQGIMETGSSWYVSTIANNTLVGSVQGDASGYQYAGGFTAEWIMEDPTNATAGSLLPFSDYGTVTFSNLETSLSSWSLPNNDAIEIVQNGVVLSLPSTVSGDGFTVNYTGS